VEDGDNGRGFVGGADVGEQQGAGGNVKRWRRLDLRRQPFEEVLERNFRVRLRGGYEPGQVVPVVVLKELDEVATDERVAGLVPVGQARPRELIQRPAWPARRKPPLVVEAVRPTRNVQGVERDAVVVAERRVRGVGALAARTALHHSSTGSPPPGMANFNVQSTPWPTSRRYSGRFQFSWKCKPL